jgi:hypothetical protein
MKRVLGLATFGVAAMLSLAGTAVGSNGGTANAKASCQGVLVSNATPKFSHVIQNDIRTTPGLEGPGIGSIVSGVASGPHHGSVESCLPAE